MAHDPRAAARAGQVDEISGGTVNGQVDQGRDFHGPTVGNPAPPPAAGGGTSPAPG
ncbi:hypothetical protein [Streptomyces sp. NPDC001388]|uniref:hypothetical protein n=1 Tax=Streptomyces sp. NPDC001388 TaxID=3364568 RepID=UPI003695DB2D